MPSPLGDAFGGMGQDWSPYSPALARVCKKWVKPAPSAPLTAPYSPFSQVSAAFVAAFPRDTTCPLRVPPLGAGGPGGDGSAEWVSRLRAQRDAAQGATRGGCGVAGPHASPLCCTVSPNRIELVTGSLNLDHELSILTGTLFVSLPSEWQG